MKRTEPFSRAAIRNASIALALPIALATGLYAATNGPLNEQTIAHAKACIELDGDSARCDRVSINRVPADLRPDFDRALVKRQAAQEERQAAQLREESRRNAEIAEAKAAADAKFKAEGWWQQEPGIYVRWCDGDNPSCPATNNYEDYVWRAMVWCKDRACGDIYAKINILDENGTVIGWTNETAYGGYGQKVVLKFGAYTKGRAQIVEFNARG